MQLPQRRSQSLRVRDDEAVIRLTPRAIGNMKAELVRLEKVERPQTVADLSVALAKGDLSENAEYTDAKARLARIDGRIFSIKDRMKRVVPIEAGPNEFGEAKLGSTVTVEVDGKVKDYTLVGSTETNPALGRISYVSPLGAALVNKAKGQTFTLKLADREVTYRVLKVS